MERLALIGVSHRRGGASALEVYQEAHAPERSSRMAEAGLEEHVAIVTCNRWDLVGTLARGARVADARRALTPPGQERPYAYIADGALEQLTRVAASLDSLNPGEDQIMKQVREAYARAQAAGTTGPTTSFAFDTALRVAKRVRREVALAPVNTSLFSLARPDLEALLTPGTSVAVLGAGAMGSLAARSLAGLRGVELIVVNRDAERGRHLADGVGARFLGLAEYLRDPPPTTALVCATPAAQLVDAVVLGRLPALRLAVDLGVPRNVDAAAAARRGVRVLDVDALQEAGRVRRGELTEKLALAEGIVREELDAAVTSWTERQLGPSIARLRDLYVRTIGDALPPDAARRLAHKFAHVPIKGLRGLAREHGLEAARTFLTEAGLVEAGRVEAGLVEAGRVEAGPTDALGRAAGGEEPG